MPVWCTVRQELRAFAGLMVFLHGEWTHAWSPRVLSFDASLSGWGVTEAFFDPELVGAVGRVPERSRFRKLPISTSARSHAMDGGADFVWDPEHESFVRAFCPDVEEAEQMWATAKDFVEIPVDMRQKGDWSPIRWGQWSRAEHITLLEARTAVRAVQHRLGMPDGRRCRLLFLGDNLGCILALSRSRAKDYGMLVQIRRVSAWALARGVRLSFRWIPSEWNTADDPSRLAEAEAVENGLLDDVIGPATRPRTHLSALRPIHRQRA